MTAAITAKYIPASTSGHTPARYKAQLGKRSTHVLASEYPDSTEATKAAVAQLLRRLKLSGVYYGGTLPDGRLVFVQPNALCVGSDDLANPHQE